MGTRSPGRPPGAGSSSPRRRVPSRRVAPSPARPHTPGHLVRGLVALLAAAALGCGSEGPTGPASRVASLRPLAGAADTVRVDRQGGSLELAVQAEEESGATVSGVQVRFIVSSGGGSLSSPTATTDDGGVARTTYSADGELGTARVRADVPSAPDVQPLLLTVQRNPGMALGLRKTSGEDQRAEAGSQLPRALAVQVVDSLGQPAGGVGLEWSLATTPPGAELRALASASDTGGVARALLRLGEVGEHVVRVRTTEPGPADTATFRATAVATLPGDVILDSVRPLPLAAGEEATLFGSGFGSSSAERRVWVEGRDARVLSAASGEIRILVPRAADRCLPDRRGGIRAEIDGTLGNGLLVSIRGSGARIDPSPGAVITLPGTNRVRCLQFPAADLGRAFRLVVQSTSRVAGAVSGLRLELRTGVQSRSAFAADATLIPADDPGVRDRAPGGTRDEPLAPLSVRGPEDPGRVAGRSPLQAASAAAARLARPGEILLRERALEELRRTGARPLPPRPAGSPARGAPGGTPASSARAGLVPEVGDLRQFNFAVSPDLTISCTRTDDRVTARVRAVGRQGALLADTAVAGAGFSDADYELLSREFSDFIFPTDTAYFGAPADIDGNERILVLFTPRVNALTPPDADAAVGGFFLPLDLVESGSPDGDGVTGPEGETCPASNEAEILYLPVPDPRGRFGPEFSRQDALRNARAIGAHELEHLLNTEQRVVLGDGDFTDVQEVWLDEGLAHLAEEVTGFAAAGMSPGDNLTFGDFAGSRERISIFNSLHLQNFGRLQLYLADPSAAPVLAQVDPGGLSGLRMRGFSWLFVRWVADRFATGDESRLIRRLATGGPSRLSGIEDVTTATGRSWEDLLEDFGAVPLLDDRTLPDAGSTAAERTRDAQVTSWNLRETYVELQENPGGRSLFPLGYPLSVTTLPFESGILELDVGASTARYLGLATVTGSPSLALGMFGPGGGAPPSSIRVLMVRLR